MSKINECNRNVSQPTPIGSPRIFQFHKEDFLYELFILRDYPPNLPIRRCVKLFATVL